MEVLQEDRDVREGGYTCPSPHRQTKRKRPIRFGFGDEVSKYGDCTYHNCDTWSAREGGAKLPVADSGDWLKTYAGADAEFILEFCQQKGILEELRTATELANECFPSRRSLRIFLDDDPDEDGQWIVVEVTTEQDVDDFLNAYNGCISLWAKTIPTEGVAFIRLSYNFT
jgi:hypothetical protein